MYVFRIRITILFKFEEGEESVEFSEDLNYPSWGLKKYWYVVMVRVTRLHYFDSDLANLQL